LPPDKPLPVDGAAASDTDIMAINNIDNRRRPAHINARHAGINQRIVIQTLATKKLRARFQVQGHSTFQEKGAGKETACRDHQSIVMVRLGNCSLNGGR
jgi:hypothetical protein